MAEVKYTNLEQLYHVFKVTCNDGIEYGEVNIFYIITIEKWNEHFECPHCKEEHKRLRSSGVTVDHEVELLGHFVIGDVLTLLGIDDTQEDSNGFYSDEYTHIPEDENVEDL